MDIHVEKRTISTAAGTGSKNTLDIRGGLMRQLYVMSGTSNVIFRFDITDEDGIVQRYYDFHKGHIDDSEVLPVRGVYTLRVTDAQLDGDFTVKMSIEQ